MLSRVYIAWRETVPKKAGKFQSVSSPPLPFTLPSLLSPGNQATTCIFNVSGNTGPVWRIRVDQCRIQLCYSFLELSFVTPGLIWLRSVDSVTSAFRIVKLQMSSICFNSSISISLFSIKLWTHIMECLKYSLSFMSLNGSSLKHGTWPQYLISDRAVFTSLHIIIHNCDIWVESDGKTWSNRAWEIILQIFVALYWHVLKCCFGYE